MNIFPSSPLPNRADMFAYNAPLLQKTEVCQFLKDMDAEELEIQTRRDSSPESSSEQVIEELKEKRKQWKWEVLKEAVTYISLPSLILSASAITGNSAFGKVIYPIAGVSGCLLALPYMISKKREIDKGRSIIECHKSNADARFKRIKNKITHISNHLNCESISQTDKKQLLIAKSFFENKVNSFQKVYDEWGRSLTFTHATLVEGGSFDESTYQVNPDSEEIKEIRKRWKVYHTTEHGRYQGPLGEYVNLKTTVTEYDRKL